MSLSVVAGSHRGLGREYSLAGGHHSRPTQIPPGRLREARAAASLPPCRPVVVRLRRRREVLGPASPTVSVALMEDWSSMTPACRSIAPASVSLATPRSVSLGDRGSRRGWSGPRSSCETASGSWRSVAFSARMSLSQWAPWLALRRAGTSSLPDIPSSHCRTQLVHEADDELAWHLGPTTGHATRSTSTTEPRPRPTLPTAQPDPS